MQQLNRHLAHSPSNHTIGPFVHLLQLPFPKAEDLITPVLVLARAVVDSVLEFRDDPEIVPGTTERPEEVRILCCRDANDIAGGSDHPGGDELIGHETVPTLKEAVPATQYGRHDAGGFAAASDYIATQPSASAVLGGSG